MGTFNNNTSILPWYSSINYQYHRKHYVEEPWSLVSERYKLPPFQIHRTTALEDTITSLVLHSTETGGTIDILAAMNLTGLIVESFSGYDLITYPGIDAMTDVQMNDGQYYAVMSDGTNTWYSEMFYMKSDVSKLIKLKYWHDEPFMFADHHISYVSPFANFVYLSNCEAGAAINKSRYTTDLDKDDRGGYPFLIYGVSNKRYRFTVLLPEFMADALRLVPLHHYVTIYHDGYTYEIDEILFNPGDWLEQGHLIPVEFEFQTNKTVVQVTGKVKPESEGYSYDQAAYDDSHL
jgi:hypothetical protein